MVFNEKLMQQRKVLGMTQEDLADRLDVSRQTVSKWENGDCMPDADKFIRLSDILEISLDELAGREVQIEPVVLPAPEIPQPGRKERRILMSVIACIITLVIGLLIGKFALASSDGGAQAQIDPSLQGNPSELKVWSFDILDGKAIFVTNTKENGTVDFYTNENPDKDPLTLQAIYNEDNGCYYVSDLPYGEYARVVFNVVSEGQELSAELVTELEYSERGASYTGRAAFDGLEETLAVSDLVVNSFDLSISDPTMAHFTSNVTEDGVLIFYPSSKGRKVFSVPAFYNDGIYIAKGVEFGRYSHIDFSVSIDGEVLETTVAENVVINEDGYYIASSNQQVLEDDYDVDEEKLDITIRKVLLYKAAEKTDDKGASCEFAEGHKIWDYDIVDGNIYAYVTAKTVAHYYDKDSNFVVQPVETGPYFVVVCVDDTGEYKAEKCIELEGDDWKEDKNNWLTQKMKSDISSEDYDSDFYQDQIDAYLGDH